MQCIQSLQDPKIKKHLPLVHRLTHSLHWCFKTYKTLQGGLHSVVRFLSLFDAEHGIQEVVCVSDMCGDEAVALQKQTVLAGAPLPPGAHAEGLQQPAARPASVFIQEDLAEQESTSWQPFASA